MTEINSLHLHDTLTGSNVPYSKRSIGIFEQQLWKPGQFLMKEQIKLPPIEKTKGKVFELPTVGDDSHTIQNDQSNFTEFDDSGVKERTGYSAEQMRLDGCGISSVYTAFDVLAHNKLRQIFPTVGLFAKDLLSKHRNDLFQFGKKIKTGTPVFNPKVGWYHDALISQAKQISGIEGYRREGIDLFDLAFDCVDHLDKGDKVLPIISIDSRLWFLSRNFDETAATHLLIVNGFRFSNKGLTDIRITDPFKKGDSKRLNEWVRIDERFIRAFKGRAIILYEKS